MNSLKYLTFFFLIVGLFSCEPSIEDKSDLGLPPNPSFDISQGDTPNTFIFTNTTEGAFLTYWDLGIFGNREGQEVEIIMPLMGTYDISMTTFNRGGSASVTKSVTVEQDDPTACFGNMLLLTNCTQKTWKLAPEEAAMHIGPNLFETWWGNSADDVISRDCHFNDRYVFRENGEFEYQPNGDFYADADGDGNVWPSDLMLEVGCQPIDAWPAQYEVWGAGVHNFTINDNSLSVIGEGAWLGLYKVGTTEEVNTPQSSVTYTIDSITEDRMVLFADYGWGVWRITLVSE